MSSRMIYIVYSTCNRPAAGYTAYVCESSSHHPSVCCLRDSNSSLANGPSALTTFVFPFPFIFSFWQEHLQALQTRQARLYCRGQKTEKCTQVSFCTPFWTNPCLSLVCDRNSEIHPHIHTRPSRSSNPIGANWGLSTLTMASSASNMNLRVTWLGHAVRRNRTSCSSTRSDARVCMYTGPTQEWYVHAISFLEE